MQGPFNAVVSVSDAMGLEELGKALADMGASIYATGGTRAKLQAAGFDAHAISGLTGFPEILGGRVKTLHPGVLSGVLARRDDPSHMEQLQQHDLQTIDLVVVNLYPFAATVQREGVTLPEAIEQIDIGGPTMIRAAAKNFSSVVVLIDPADYVLVLTEWREKGEVSRQTRLRLAAKAFRHVSDYDNLVANFLNKQETQIAAAEMTDADAPPSALTLELTQVQALRYGENPHQSAALYRDNLPVSGSTLVGSLQQLKGPELSYNNLLDADAALSIVRDYAMPAVAIIKHAGPCGIATGAKESLLGDIFALALACDPVSAFGGIVGVNRPVDAELAEIIARTRFDLLVAPRYTDEAVDLLARRKNLRILTVPDPDGSSRDDAFESPFAFRQISGGFLVQTRDSTHEELVLEPVTQRHPTLDEIADLTFAWRAVKHVKSNAIILAHNKATVGIGGGQPNRVDSVRIAVTRAGVHSQGAVLASDAFFPFADGIEVAAEAGITAIVQPGGSVNDSAAIAAADRAGIAMVFTHRRHFKH